MIKIKNAEFVISNTDYKLCPTTNIPEYAFIGRSNVGKSSLINALVNQQGLAKTSSKPGKTQLINHFIINQKWYLVDLPGIGYAKVAKSKRTYFHKMITDYLLYRENLVCLFFLIDCRHIPQQIDQDFMKWLSNKKIPFIIIFTKIDKTSKNSLEKKINFYKTEMNKEWSELPEIFITSAKEKKGIQQIIDFISKLNSNFK